MSIRLIYRLAYPLALYLLYICIPQPLSPCLYQLRVATPLTPLVKRLLVQGKVHLMLTYRKLNLRWILRRTRGGVSLYTEADHTMRKLFLRVAVQRLCQIWMINKWGRWCKNYLRFTPQLHQDIQDKGLWRFYPFFFCNTFVRNKWC